MWHPWGIMQADMDEPLAKLLTKVDKEKYAECTTEENGKLVIYMELRKALYATLQAFLLFWRDLSCKLEKWGLLLNPYDNCVTNKTIIGSRCTILWHVDDLKVSHTDPVVVDNMIREGSTTYCHKRKNPRLSWNNSGFLKKRKSYN